MPLVSDGFHNKKLKELGINIKTKYIVGNKVLERNTNNETNDDITAGIRCEKDYYISNQLIHKETLFDSRIEYTFVSKEMENEDYKCPNCGMQGKTKEFLDGCPYCRTYYNIEYTDKDLGSKYHYDRVLKNNLYQIITGVVDLIISIIICFFYIKITSRTFNNIDITKVFLYGLVLAMILYYFFYLLDAYIILGPIKRYKDRQNQKQIDFWNRTQIAKKNFFNNFNYEVRKLYHNKKDVIDFDIIDYLDFKYLMKKKIPYIKVLAEIRIVYYNKEKIKSKISKEEFTFKKNLNDKLEIKEGINYLKCHNCGASVDASKDGCPYCHKELKYLQEWILEDNKD